jgi:hypothetical protein
MDHKNLDQRPAHPDEKKPGQQQPQRPQQPGQAPKNPSHNPQNPQKKSPY